MLRQFEGLAFRPADILLPRDCEYCKWSVVACDQYTSQPDYWQRVEEYVGSAPSALRLILPESCLDGPNVETDIMEVNNTMTREFWLHDRVTLLRGLMDRFGAKPVYDSENGYLTRHPDRRVEKYPLRSVSESGIAAAFMVRSYLQALAYGLSNKMWFTVDGYGGFGITEYGQPRPAYPAYAAMTRLLLDSGMRASTSSMIRSIRLISSCMALLAFVMCPGYH